jgi:hypothetical protein
VGGNSLVKDGDTGRELLECYCEGRFRMNVLIFKHKYLSICDFAICGSRSRATPESAVVYSNNESAA